MRVGTWVNFFSEARGDGGVGVFLESTTSFRAAGDGDAGRVVTVTEVVRGDAPTEARAEGDAGRGVNFTEDDVRRAVRGVGFTEGEVGQGVSLTEVIEGLGKDFTEVSGNGTTTPDNLGFSTLGTPRGEEEGDGRGDIFNEVRAGLTEDRAEVGGNGTTTLDDFR